MRLIIRKSLKKNLKKYKYFEIFSNLINAFYVYIASYNLFFYFYY